MKSKFGSRKMIDGKKVCGIVCEYNPFHNGHKYQIDQTRRLGYDYIICAMSGSMVQRGDVAVYDKWFRAKTAVENGADLVIEIPAYYVLQSAQNYAHGAVRLIDSLGIADGLSFGSESADLHRLNEISDILCNEPQIFKDTIAAALKNGLSYPAACAAAFAETLADAQFSLMPNDTLAVNYMSALKKIGSSITPVAVTRSGGYHDTAPLSADCASATAVRALISDGKDISAYVPNISNERYNINRIESLILGTLRLADASKLGDTTGMEPGLANRLISCAKSAASLDEFFAACVSKRYTAHRIRRTVLCAMLTMKQGFVHDYIRVLSFNENGKNILAHIKKKSGLAIVTKTADFVPRENSAFRFDIAATDIAALCCNFPEKRKSGKDFTTSPSFVR